jgi:hypothetical protein
MARGGDDIRTLINLTATATFGMIILAGGIAAYHGAPYSVTNLPGDVWNHRGASPARTPVPTYAAGVTVHGDSSPTPKPPATAIPSPIPTPTVDPRADECGWAAFTLRADARLDIAGENRAGPEWHDYYELWAGRWRTIADWIGPCSPLPASECASARGWIDFAISTHKVTGSAVVHDPAMDQQWLANYDRVLKLLQEVCS